MMTLRIIGFTGGASAWAITEFIAAQKLTQKYGYTLTQSTVAAPEIGEGQNHGWAGKTQKFAENGWFL